MLLSAGVAGAQSPQPTGMVSPSNPVLFTHDGLPDGNGDLAAGVEYFAATTGPGLVGVNFGNVNCNGSPIFRALAEAMPPTGPVNEFSAGSGMVMISELDSSDAAHPRPIGADYTEPSGPGQGQAMMLDSNGDHLYERLMIQGANGDGPVAAELDLQSYDPDGDGKPEFVTLFDPAPADPQFNLGVLQFFGLSCDDGHTYDKAWIPVGRDLDDDPAIIGDLNGDGIADPPFLWGPKLQVGARSLVQIPTLSGFGLAALAALLLFVGVRLMRRHGSEAGA
jgi:hypothetical protein